MIIGAFEGDNREFLMDKRRATGKSTMDSITDPPTPLINPAWEIAWLKKRSEGKLSKDTLNARLDI